MSYRCLLVGAGGRLGSVLRSRMGAGWELTPFTRGGGGDTGSCDLLCMEEVRSMLRGDYDLIVNCASVSSKDYCSSNPSECLAVNTRWPALLARHCRERSIPMIHISSDLVYSGCNAPYNERSPAVPLSLYGWSKLAADDIVGRNCPWALIVRTSVLCGETLSGRSTFTEGILSGNLRYFYVNSWRNHTPILWLADLILGLRKEGSTGLVIASGPTCRSRSAYAQEILRKHGMDAEEIGLGYSPEGVPERIDLRGKYTSETDLV